MEKKNKIAESHNIISCIYEKPHAPIDCREKKLKGKNGKKKMERKRLKN